MSGEECFEKYAGEWDDKEAATPDDKAEDREPPGSMSDRKAERAERLAQGPPTSWGVGPEPTAATPEPGGLDTEAEVDKFRSLYQSVLGVRPFLGPKFIEAFTAYVRDSAAQYKPAVELSGWPEVVVTTADAEAILVAAHKSWMDPVNFKIPWAERVRHALQAWLDSKPRPKPSPWRPASEPPVVPEGKEGIEVLTKTNWPDEVRDDVQYYCLRFGWCETQPDPVAWMYIPEYDLPIREERPRGGEDIVGGAAGEVPGSVRTGEGEGGANGDPIAPYRSDLDRLRAGHVRPS